MQIAIKIILSLAIILAATFVARKNPSLAGLIGVMPLTGLLVVIWVFFENKEKPEAVISCVTGSLFGILPTLLFFGVVLACLKWKVPFSLAIVFGFAIWLGGAFLHQHLLK